MGLEKGEPKSSKVLIYPPGSTDFVLYQGTHMFTTAPVKRPRGPLGAFIRHSLTFFLPLSPPLGACTCAPTGIQKHDSLSKFFDSVIDGTADLSVVNKQAAEEEFVPDENELEIERKQEAQRMALAHGGFSDLIDFEEAIKNGAGADFHAQHGYPGMMGGGMPKKAAEGEKGAGEGKPAHDEDIIRNIMKASQEAERKEREQPKMAKTDDAGQVVFKAAETGHSRTPAAGEETGRASASATAEAATPSVEERAEAVAPEDAPVVAGEDVPAAAEDASSSATSKAAVEASTTPGNVEATKSAGHVADEL